RYDIPLGRDNLSLQADGSFVADRFFTSDNTPVFRGRSYWLFDARMVYQPLDSNWQFAVWVRNIGNRAYRVEGFNQFGFSGDSYFAYGVPRRFGVSLSTNF
ncbi:MAG: hypothetical protein GXP02_02745, partial [Alphaproteobacteria bacterium]|nr:hypothetical protein [Alphaproteobacteria bacterium]